MPKAIVKLRARLKINGVVAPISEFTLDFPKAAVGATFTARLADTARVIAESDSIDFEIGVEKAGVTSWVKYVDAGNVAGFAARVEFANNQLQLNAVTKLGDRWRFSPRQPLIVYDENLISFGDVTEAARGDVLDEDYDSILPRFVATRDLKLKELLKRAYVDGCGFKSVETNLPNYSVRRQDFGIRQSYHDAVRGLFALWNPVIFADDNDVLWIIDIDGQLPAGMQAATRQLTTARYVGADFNQPPLARINAVLLTYQEAASDASDEFPANATDRIKIISPPPDASGALRLGQRLKSGARGWSQQIIENHYKDFHDDPQRPEKVTRSILWKKVVTTYAGDEQSGLPLMLERTTQSDLYTNNFRLKVGFDKVVERRQPLPYGKGKTLYMVESEREQNRIIWADSVFNPAVKLKLWEITEHDGLILVEGVYTLTDKGVAPYQYTSQITSAQPLTNAATNRNVTQDGFQQIVWGEISTTIQSTSDTGTNQIDLITTRIDHLIPHTDVQVTQQAIADRSVNIDALAAVTILLRDRDREALDGGFFPPLEINAGLVPVDIAMPIAKRRLKRGGAPPLQIPFELPNFDAALRRGSLRSIQDDKGDFHLSLVEGFKIGGKNLGSASSEITQTADSVIVVNV